MPEPVRVLSVDGGGIRGIIPALVLVEIERRTARPLAELFELIAGTSTGAIIACALTQPGPDGGPAWNAQALVQLYERDGPAIFHRSLHQRIRSVEGLIDEKYDTGALDAALERYLGETRLSEVLTDVLLTAYDTAAREPFFFKSTYAREDPGRDFTLRVAARASSSAPTYFEPLPVAGRSLIDGGVFATNPAMCGFAEVLRDSPGTEVVLVSLGTGEQTRPLPFEEVKDWGLVSWARPILDVVFDGVSDTVDYQLRQALGAGRYWRLQIPLVGASDDLDDASERNLRALREHGERLVAERSAEIDAICEALTS